MLHTKAVRSENDIIKCIERSFGVCTKVCIASKCEVLVENNIDD